MKRYTPTRSIATLVMGLAVMALLALVVAVPVVGIAPMTVAYVAMLVAGTGMLLRERILTRTSA